MSEASKPTRPRKCTKPKKPKGHPVEIIIPGVGSQILYFDKALTLSPKAGGRR